MSLPAAGENASCQKDFFKMRVKCDEVGSHHVADHKKRGDVMNADQDTVKGVILSGRIISGAMIVGMVTFGMVVLVLGERVASQASLGWVFVGVVALSTLAFLVAYPLFRATIVRAAKAQCEQSGQTGMPTGSIARVYAQLVIIRAAMAEGVGLAGLVFLLITGQKLLWAAPVIAIVLLAAGLPSRSRFDSFAQEVTGVNPYGG